LLIDLEDRNGRVLTTDQTIRGRSVSRPPFSAAATLGIQVDHRVRRPSFSGI
jgi:hypothetical protein